MKQNLKSALIAALVAGVIAAPVSYAAGESATDQRQDRQIAALQHRAATDEATLRYAFVSMNQLQCEIEHGANAAVCG